MRAKPFSGKKKKQQLQEKRQRKQVNDDGEHFSDIEVALEIGNEKPLLVSEWETRKASQKPKPNENPLYLSPLAKKDKACLEISFEQFFPEKNSMFSLPRRPEWAYDMSKETLEEREKEYFKSWLDQIYSGTSTDELGYFEHNLEVWRQLWRVCEISDVIVVVADARHPILGFPPSLYQYIVDELKKPMCLVLTRTDLVGEITTTAWKEYILTKFPNLFIVNTSIYDMSAIDARVRPRRYESSSGIDEVFDTLIHLTQGRHLAEWKHFRGNKSVDSMYSGPIGEENDLITIGLLGQPNAGKSSLLNSISGRKRVSASKTPGHTKHFQTIHLTKHIRLCDCPGLIFPMKIPKWLQILSGIYNVAQVKDPYEPLLHLAELIDLPRDLGLDSSSDNIIEICEAYATKRGFFTAKAARPDIYRAANFLLRAVHEGAILVSWKPLGYYDRFDDTPRVENHSDIQLSEEDGFSAESSEGVGDSFDDCPPTGVIGGAFSLLQDSD